jgi:RNase H-like domain found in reverse transcriptase
LDIDKCAFEVKSTKYLGFIIEAGKGIRMDPEKVKAIMDWEVPRSVKGVRSFLGFANFYRRFIRDFSEIVAPLTDLTKNDKAFVWTDDADKAFQRLKRLFTTAPILVQFDPECETVVEADSSGWATGGVLSQYGDDGMLRPCAYFSRKNTPAECNYEIHDKELLAIISCLRE